MPEGSCCGQTITLTTGTRARRHPKVPATHLWFCAEGVANGNAKWRKLGRFSYVTVLNKDRTAVLTWPLQGKLVHEQALEHTHGPFWWAKPWEWGIGSSLEQQLTGGSRTPTCDDGHFRGVWWRPMVTSQAPFHSSVLQTCNLSS